MRSRINSDLRIYKVALFLNAFVLGITLVAYARARANEGCRIIDLRPAPTCYTWHDGVVQCNKPKEIDV